MSMKIAFLFPGQGSQSVGMGRALCEETEIGRRRFEEASEILGFDLITPCFQGPEEALKKTAVAQPALYVCGVIVSELLRERGIEPTHAAGHSLGEYTALSAAGVFDFATGLRLVKARGEAMNAASEATTGVMAAIIGLGVEVVAELCDEAKALGAVALANINAPGQIVVSGEPDAVGAVTEAAKTKGAKRALPLAVHGAFHSPLMASAAKPLAKALGEADFAAPTLRFVANTTGTFLDNPTEIERQLAAQITGCVRWVTSMETLLEDGVERCAELGTGSVLSGLLKRIRRDVPCLSVGDPAGIEKVVEAVSAKT